ncbi:lysophospholipid acyltransferase family protein [Cellulomonas wangsupingiae]|uniref:1-acyl-sn-glycerol-3-phosphate acyltransferase n=1 Tax=Cellulomonas wangsupingiae TaxID=2968085 RepID=A0ABY5K4N2_9CELL|nr:lysophospholipid acyltransferase family protein [Cellulomonas wangsupingiae]MCC2336018.1 1-acyl-sn-glycerol-3-phosphate acyltransferase [Cellulomonas wangsupingiae]MCM0639671.1 1-acyl-sn-glycerol-3-phosphate acyltransferase [Cellulomonas wangsupingiae]UUI64743.1 1-acyl-sn-glycerol-3-phosphate acyltransferase [Cellulomonas wangsupingiae]
MSDDARASAGDVAPGPDDAPSAERHPHAHAYAHASAETFRRLRRRVGLPPGFNLAGAVRHLVWRNAFHLVGGFRVVGSAPYEAMVVVANHQSHADTPALLAAFPSSYKPVVVAAGDYWFDNPWKARLLKVLIGAVPVRRHGGGGYESLIAGATQVLGSGSSLMVFPEGTRSTDGRLGRFRSGALRIAQEFDVPILPVAVVGTRELLAKKGRLTPGPVEVRVGHPVDPQELTDMAPLVAQIEGMLAAGPPVPSTSKSWRVVRGFMAGPAGLAGAVVWGFAEAVSLPVTSEMYLVLVAAAHPRRVLPAAACLAVGSAAGVLVTRAMTAQGDRPWAPLTTPAMRERAARDLAVAGARGIWRQALNGVPVKVYAAEAGAADVPAVALAVHALGARAARSLAVGAVVRVAAGAGAPVLRRLYGPYLGAAGVTFAIGLGLVVRRWSR